MSMRSELFRDHTYFTRGYANHLPAQFMRALKDELALTVDDQYYLPASELDANRKVALKLKDLIDTLENGVDAPAPDAGISLESGPDAMTGTSAQ